jgi:hypothetical protein
MSEQLSQVKVRLPRELTDWVKLQAAANRRSLSAEIVFRLEQAKNLQEAA